ncbi:MAG: serine protease, partial [Cyanobacteria bacterium J06627_28]
DSPDFDPFLVLMGPDGSVVGYNDDTGTSSLNSAMTVTLPSNGRYRVIANAFDSSGRGRFTLNVEPF